MSIQQLALSFMFAAGILVGTLGGALAARYGHLWAAVATGLAAFAATVIVLRKLDQLEDDQ